MMKIFRNNMLMPVIFFKGIKIKWVRLLSCYAVLFAVFGSSGMPWSISSIAHADEKGFSSLKTIHMQLRKNELSQFPEGQIETLRLAQQCPGSQPVPPFPSGQHPLLPEVNMGTILNNVVVDIYWSGTRFAYYSKGTSYGLANCAWIGKPANHAEIIDYKEGTAYSIDFTDGTWRKGRGTHYRDPKYKYIDVQDFMRKNGAIAHSNMIAKQRCVWMPIAQSKDPFDKMCVWKDLITFPNTGNLIELASQGHLDMSGGMKIIIKEEATLFEVNAPIPDDKFKVPANFRQTR